MLSVLDAQEQECFGSRHRGLNTRFFLQKSRLLSLDIDKLVPDAGEEIPPPRQFVPNSGLLQLSFNAQRGLCRLRCQIRSSRTWTWGP